MLKKIGMTASVLALMVLMLAGCSNGMLEKDDATVNGQLVERSNIQLTITNFAGSSSGPLRTIAPEQPDITGGGYVFVATGTSVRKTMTPTIITVDANGNADLTGLEVGLWNLTVTAYDITKLGAVDQGNATAVMGVAEAAVLSGSALLDARGTSGNAEITLTPSGLGTEGDVDLTIQFNQDDQQKIQTGNFTVKIGLYDRVDGAAKDEEDKSVDARASATVDYEAADMAKGEYTFKVTIEDGQGRVWNYSDNLYVLGNTTTDGNIILPQLIGEAPAAPEKFVVYWDSSRVDSVTGDFIATFAWDRTSYNESSYDLQILDITDKFGDTGNGVEYDGQQVQDAAALWNTINDEVTGVMGKDNYSSTAYPIFGKEGSLLAGSNKVEYKLQTGRVYAVRIRTVNANGNSAWVNIQAVNEPQSKPAAGTAKKFEGIVVNLFTITYELDKFILLKDAQQATTDAIHTNVVADAYVPGTPHTIDYKVADYQLYPSSFNGTAAVGSLDRITAWNGWANLANKATLYTDEYDGYENVVVIPAGASHSASLDVIAPGTYKDLLTDQVLLIDLQTTNGVTVTWDKSKNLAGKTTDVSSTTLGLGQVGGVYAVNMDAGQPATKQILYFSVGDEVPQAGVGGAQFEEGKLVDADGRTQMIEKVTYILKDTSGKEIAKVEGRVSASIEITGENDGDYILYVEATSSTGYNFSFQTPFIITYNDITIP